MLVNDCMTRHPILIPSNTPASQAQRIMMENNIRHLPVAGDGKRLQGLVTRQTLKFDPELIASFDVWEVNRFLSHLTVDRMMVKAEDVYTIDPEKTVERAARMMVDYKIGCLPVIEDVDVVVGILTEMDLLHVFQEMLALPANGLRLTLRMPDAKGEFSKLARVLSENDIGVMGIGTYPSPRHEGYYDAVLKTRNCTMEQAKAAFGTLEGYEIVDMRFEV